MVNKLEGCEIASGIGPAAGPSHDHPDAPLSSQPAIRRLPARAARGARKPSHTGPSTEADRLPRKLGYPWERHKAVDVEHLVSWAYGEQRLDANPVTGLHELEARAAGYHWQGHSPDGCWSIEQRHMIGASIDVSGGPSKETFHPVALAVGQAVERCSAAALVREWGRLGVRPDGWREPDHWIRPRSWKDDGVTGETEHASPRVVYTPVRPARSTASIDLARSTYRAWHEALTGLWLLLSTRALGFVVLPPAALAEPWKVTNAVVRTGAGITDETFDVTIAASRPTLAVFTAAWCSPSRALVAEAEHLAGAVKGVATFAIVDVDVAQTVALREKVHGLPLLALYRDGRLIAQHLGGLGRRGLRTWVVDALAKKSD